VAKLGFAGRATSRAGPSRTLAPERFTGEFAGADAATKELILVHPGAEAKIIAFYCSMNHVAVRDCGMYSGESTDAFGASIKSERRGVNSAEAGATSRG